MPPARGLTTPFISNWKRRAVSGPMAMPDFTLRMLSCRSLVCCNRLTTFCSSGERSGNRFRVVAYQVVTSLRIRHTDGTRKGKDATVVTLGNLCRNQPSPLSRTFYDDTTVRHTRHDTVAPHKVGLVSICLRHKFR